MTNRIAQARKAAQGRKASADKAEPVTLATVLAADDIVATLARTFGLVATDQDVADLGTVVLADVTGRLADVGRVAAAAAGLKVTGKPSPKVRPEDVRLSTKDGLKAYAYVVLPSDSGTVLAGLTISDSVGRVLAAYAGRK